MRLFIVLLSASLAFGATRKEPPDCSSRPCTYTITCAAKTCTAAEVREVQAALDEAHRGDTIKLQADRIFPAGTAGLVIKRRPGSDGYLTITTTEDARLPEGNTRITPAYASLLPTIAASSSGGFALGLAGSDQPAEYIRLVGLRFAAITTTQGTLLMIGNDGNHYDWRFPERPYSAATQPDNIVVDRCLFEQDFSFFVRRLIAVHARRTTIANSYLDGARARATSIDTQSISADHGPGPLTVYNSYIGAATENMIFGGSGPLFEEGVYSADIRFNYFPKVEERTRFSLWRAGMVVFKGRIIRPSQSRLTYQAENSGVTGNVEPLWPAAGTVNDNGIVWRQIAGSDNRHAMKNSFEIKNARGVRIQYNVFDRHWYDYDNQNSNIVFKLSNCVEKSSTCQCVPEYTGAVFVNGSVVTSADGNPLPNLHEPTVRNSVDPFVITIGGTDYRIDSFEPADDNRITLRSDAGLQPGVQYQYTYGLPKCRAAWDKDIEFRNNVVRSGPVGLSILQWTNGVRGRIGNILVKDNLFTDIDCRKWGDYFRSCSTGSIWPFVYLGALPEKIEINHNTIVGKNAVRGIHFEGNRNRHEGDGKILNNIFPRGSAAGIAGGPHQEGSSTLDNLLCGGSPCPESQFDKNIVAGADLSRYNTGTTYNLCPDRRRCDDPQYGSLFENFQAGIYRVRDDHVAKRGGTDGADIGADFDQLPQIRDLRVETTDRLALLTYQISKPIEQIPCVLEVSTERDLSSPIPDLDTFRFLRPDTDHHRDSFVRGGQRMIRVGKNVPLSPEQTYWYRLQCGGDAATGSFTTKAPQTGSQRLTITHTPSASGVVATVIEFGYGYDRSSDAIINWTAAEPVSCSKDTACQISIAVDPGEILYYRTIDRDQNGAELARTPVMATSDPSASAFPQPRFTLDSVVNAAAPTYRAGEVAPCEIISIFGSGLGPEQPASFADVPLPESLANVRVLFDRKAAPLLFVWGGQLNSVAPARIAGQSLTEVQIEYGSQRSDPVMVPVAQVSPGVITNDGSGRGQGAVINPDGSFNGPSNPASRGSVVQVYGTSGGPMSPACEEGKIAEGPQYLQLPVSAVIGEGTSQVAASVEYAGSAPGSIMGLLQINLRIPENAPTGDAVPFTITIGGVPTQSGVTLAIQ